MASLIISEGGVAAVVAADRWINKRSRQLAPLYKLYVNDYGSIIPSKGKESESLRYLEHQVAYAVKHSKVKTVYVLVRQDQASQWQAVMTDWAKQFLGVQLMIVNALS